MYRLFHVQTETFTLNVNVFALFVGVALLFSI